MASMTPVFADADLTRVSFAKNLLQSAGIPCVLHNEGHHTLGPPIFTHPDRVILNPTLAVLDDAQAGEALEIIEAHFGAPPADSPDWTCPSCNETSPGTFDVCWSCGAARPASSQPDPAP